MKFTLYVSGQMTGLPQHNFPAFNHAADQLRSAGYHVENPAENPPGLQRHEYMRLDYQRVMRSSGVATLPDHHYSPGAASELDMASNLRLPMASVEYWLGEAARYQELLDCLAFYARQPEGISTRARATIKQLEGGAA